MGDHWPSGLFKTAYITANKLDVILQTSNRLRQKKKTVSVFCILLIAVKKKSKKYKPKNDSVPDHDVVFRRSSANSCWWILLKTEKQVTRKSYTTYTTPTLRQH